VPVVCDEAQNLLDPHLDGELDAAHALEVEEHVAGCPRCAAELAQLQGLRKALRRDLAYHRAPDELRARVTASLAIPAPEPARPARVAVARRPWWTALAAGLALGMVLGGSGTGYLAWRQGQDRSADALLASHLRALQPGHLIDVPTSDRHEVKPWFDGRVDYAPPVKDLSGAGFPLLGGRLDYAEGRDVAVIVYGRRKHAIDLYVWPAAPGAPPESGAYREAGYNMRRWTEDGFVLWAVSDLNAEELDAFVEAWRRTS
jgi:anti-sigma factor (TIGR02949 family)